MKTTEALLKSINRYGWLDQNKKLPEKFTFPFKTNI